MLWLAQGAAVQERGRGVVHHSSKTVSVADSDNVPVAMYYIVIASCSTSIGGVLLLSHVTKRDSMCITLCKVRVTAHTEYHGHKVQADTCICAEFKRAVVFRKHHPASVSTTVQSRTMIDSVAEIK